MQMYNAYFGAFAGFTFSVMLLVDTHTQRDQPLKMGFLDLGNFKACKSIKNLNFEILTQKTVLSLPYMDRRN